MDQARRKIDETANTFAQALAQIESRGKQTVGAISLALKKREQQIHDQMDSFVRSLAPLLCDVEEVSIEVEQESRQVLQHACRELSIVRQYKLSTLHKHYKTAQRLIGGKSNRKSAFDKSTKTGKKHS